MKGSSFGYRRILLFCWDKDDLLVDRLLFSLNRLPAEIIIVKPESVSDAIGELSSPAVTACLFVISPGAISDPLFGRALRGCMKQLGCRREFRLFVHLSGIKRHELDSMAERTVNDRPLFPAVGDLLDSVHIGESSNQEQTDNLAQSVDEYLRQLPEILDYLKYDRWKIVTLRIVPLLSGAFMVAFAIGGWNMAFHFQSTIESEAFPWILATIGVISYSSFLAICSFGSTLKTGAYFRVAMALFPLWIISSIPSSSLITNWSFLAVGFGIGILLDSSRRMWAQFSREQIPVAIAEQEASDDSNVDEHDAVTFATGGRFWQMLTTAPVLPREPKVFISYSRSSLWGSATANALHENLKATDTPSFLDVEGIAEGTSWRHKLQQAIGKATVFVSVQDRQTADRPWPNAELNAALQSQSYCGLPSILILRDPTLISAPNSQTATCLLEALILQKGEVDPALLRIIDFKPDTPRNLALGLSSFEPASVINPTLGAIFGYALGPLRILFAALGSVGVAISLIAVVMSFICYLLEIDVAAFLRLSRFATPITLLFAFLLGFVSRLVFATRFEVRAVDAPQMFWIHLFALIALAWMLFIIVPSETNIIILFATMVCGIGFLSACDFVSKSLPGTGKYRVPPV